MTITAETIDAWANDSQGPVALHLKQKLISVEGEDAVIFPPTYADIGYNIDMLSDGTKVATIDSVGSQANRMEPLFKQDPYAALVPQIKVTLGNEKTVSIFDVGHRLGDALIRCSELGKEATEAFKNFQEHNNVEELARIAPTSLVFGVWDSRGDGVKLPRLVNSIIRAWDAEELHCSAQYNPPIDYVAEGLLEEAKDKKEADNRSSRGYRHAPAVWRDDARKERVVGGIIAKGGIFRDVTVNLVALRRLNSPDQCEELRQYILGLTLVAATYPQDGFLRQGCLLTPDPDSSAKWTLVHRDGKREEVTLTPESVFSYAKTKAKDFGIRDIPTVKFDKKLAEIDLKKKEK